MIKPVKASVTVEYADGSTCQFELRGTDGWPLRISLGLDDEHADDLSLDWLRDRFRWWPTPIKFTASSLAGTVIFDDSQDRNEGDRRG